MARIRFWRRLAGNRDGNAIVEFAALVPVLMAAIAGSWELSYRYFAQISLDNQVDRAVRQAIAQKVGCTSDKTQAVKDMVLHGMASFAPSDDIEIAVKSYADFTSVDQPEPYTDANHNNKYDQGESYTDINGNSKWDADRGRVDDLGGPGDVIRYQITYPLRQLVPPIPYLTDGDVTLTSSTVARNEPYEC